MELLLGLVVGVFISCWPHELWLKTLPWVCTEIQHEEACWEVKYSTRKSWVLFYLMTYPEYCISIYMSTGGALSDILYLWLDIGKLTEISHSPYSMLLAQLHNSHIHILPMHCCINRLTWLVCFSRAGLSTTCEVMTETMGLMEGTGWEVSYGSYIHPVLVRHLLGPLGLSGPMTGTSWNHNYSKQSYWKI